MNRVLSFLAGDGSLLYTKWQMTIVASEYYPAFGGEGSITLQGDQMCCRLSNERELLLADFKHTPFDSSEKWYSLDIAYQHITGRIPKSGVLSGELLQYFMNSFAEIASLFSGKESPGSLAGQLTLLEAARSKRLFG